MSNASYILENQKKLSNKKCRFLMWSTIGFLLLAGVAGIAFAVTKQDGSRDSSEEGAVQYLQELDGKYSYITQKSVEGAWNYESNLTEHNLQIQLDRSLEAATFQVATAEECNKYPWKSYKDPDVRRKFEKLAFVGSAILPPERFKELEKTKSLMQGIYSKATICDFHKKDKCDLNLEPEITEAMAISKDPEELKHLWVSWRNSSGRQVREHYKNYVRMANEVALLNNYTDAGKMWIRDYEAEDFPEQVEELWKQLEPLYQQLHAYVRRRLWEQYGDKVLSRTGPIPAHLLGNMWAQTWENVANLTRPFQNKPSLDVSQALVDQGYTPVKIFKLAEEFFVSLNLSAMPESFWNNSILEKPKDRDIVCHASAWDFFDGKDFRIKQCTEIKQHHMETAHHEMGHIQYFLQYKHQPVVYRNGANPGFHEAVGDVISLSVGSAAHLHKLKLLPSIPNDREAEINQLFTVALHKIAFLPFGYLIDQYRWANFRGGITNDTLNCEWWKLREKYQGLEPPVDRSEEDFDAGAKYHIVGTVPYIRYFVSFVVQFQFHKSLCQAAGQYDPANPDLKRLHQCDIHGNTAAGKLLGDMLKMGDSKPWPDAMEAITGQRKMSAGALLEYFRPLQLWLEAENKRTNETIGWSPTKRVCKAKASKTN